MVGATACSPAAYKLHSRERYILSTCCRGKRGTKTDGPKSVHGTNKNTPIYNANNSNNRPNIKPKPFVDKSHLHSRRSVKAKARIFESNPRRKTKKQRALWRSSNNNNNYRYYLPSQKPGTVKAIARGIESKNNPTSHVSVLNYNANNNSNLNDDTNSNVNLSNLNDD